MAIGQDWNELDRKVFMAGVGGAVVTMIGFSLCTLAGKPDCGFFSKYPDQNTNQSSTTTAPLAEQDLVTDWEAFLLNILPAEQPLPIAGHIKDDS
jgi:hypothetical protein